MGEVPLYVRTHTRVWADFSGACFCAPSSKVCLKELYDALNLFLKVFRSRLSRGTYKSDSSAPERFDIAILAVLFLWPFRRNIFHFEMDGFVPRIQDINLRIVRRRHKFLYGGTDTTTSCWVAEYSLYNSCSDSRGRDHHRRHREKRMTTIKPETIQRRATDNAGCLTVFWEQ